MDNKLKKDLKAIQKELKAMEKWIAKIVNKHRRTKTIGAK